MCYIINPLMGNPKGGVCMTLYIDGRTVEPRPGSSLLSLIRELGMDRDKLSQRPLAAKIAGEVFNLN